MNLYLISQNKNSDWDTYDSAVVAALSEGDARKINPDGEWQEEDFPFGGWVKYSEIRCIEVKYLGETILERGVILASFNAG